MEIIKKLGLNTGICTYENVRVTFRRNCFSSQNHVKATEGMD